MKMFIRLKDLRQDRGIYQSELATILQIGQSSVSRLELRPVAAITYPQYKALCERFGDDTVNNFVQESRDMQINVSSNTNHGAGNQDNSVSMSLDDPLVSIVQRQSATIARMADKITEQTDRLLRILEKINGIES